MTDARPRGNVRDLSDPPQSSEEEEEIDGEEEAPEFPEIPGFGEDLASQRRKKLFSPFLPRRFVRSLASKRIRLEDREQILSKDDMDRMQKEMHTPWEGDDAPPKKRSGPPYLTLTLIAAVLGTGLYFLITSKDQEPPSPEPSPSLPPFDEEKAGKQISAAIKTLSEATDVETILGVIRFANKIGPRVKAYYRENPPTPRAVRFVTTDPNSTLHSELGVLVMRTTVLFEDFGERIAVIEWRQGEVKVDWEHWVHYNPIPVADFVAGSAPDSGNEFEFRLAGRSPADHRSSPAFPEETYASYLLWDEKNSGDEFAAHVRRGTNAHRRLAEYLVETTPRALIVRLRRKEAEGDPAIEITGFVTDGWVRSTW